MSNENKAGQGEAVATISWQQPSCEWTLNMLCEPTVGEGVDVPLYFAPRASADAVSVPTEWRDMLEELQWQHRDADDYYHKPAGFYCPICGSGAADGHISNCRIRALLAQSESKG